MVIEKYTIGTGDRFGMQAKAQLEAIIKAENMGIKVSPVWNKSHREHSIIKTSPEDTRISADNAVLDLNWKGNYYVDADHINLNNVSLFINSSDFFTLDVADYIGKKAEGEDIEAFISENLKYTGTLSIKGIDRTIEITEEELRAIAEKYLFAIKEAGKIYRLIEEKKGKDNFITEVSMDETNEAQSPVELFFILSAISLEKIPVQTIAPKFSGRFNKGVDYDGKIEKFEVEFNEDLAVIEFAKNEFSLPSSLKLSVHSGSDKFSIYNIIGKAIKKFNSGLHLKTAGTSWLEEIIGLAEAGGEGLALAKKIYRKSIIKIDELCAPYQSVVDINHKQLPSIYEVDNWDKIKYVNTLRHDPSNRDYNSSFRQLLHVGYKVAADMGVEYIETLKKFEHYVSANVTENIYHRHIMKIFA